jgi:hypothetical protein
MQRFLIVFIVFLAAGCHNTANNPVPTEKTIEIHVQRMTSTEALIVMGYHDEPDYVDAEFLVLEPEKYAGRKFKLRLIPESCDSFFPTSSFGFAFLKLSPVAKTVSEKTRTGA